jgi:hypothetical protein
MPIFSAVTSSTLLIHAFGLSPRFFGFFPHADDVAGSGVVTREGEQGSVGLVEIRVGEIL